MFGFDPIKVRDMLAGGFLIVLAVIAGIGLIRLRILSKHL